MDRKVYVYILFMLLVVMSSCAGELSRGGFLNSYRILSYEEKGELSYNRFIELLCFYDVIFLGELHNDKRIHYLELEIIKDIYRCRGSLSVAMEMFDRDVQGDIDLYFSGEIGEALFLSRSRPWSNYLEDYRGIIEYAKGHSISLIGMNVPRSILREVVRGGMSRIEGLYGEGLDWFAEDIDWNNYIYRDYFYNSLPDKGHGSGISLENFFLASLLKDTTMAKVMSEHIVSGVKLVSINGRFHSDYGVGIPNELRKRSSGIKVAVVSFLVGEEVDSLDFYLSSPIKLADYIVSID